MMTALAFDPGFGNTKLFGERGGLVIPSVVAVGQVAVTARMAGLRSARPPLRVETESGGFYVGEHAHDWGRPVENLDFDRLTGSPEMMALLYGALSGYDIPDGPVSLIVGLPIGALLDVHADATKQALRAALRRTHVWRANGVDRAVQVGEVRITSQPVGAMFDYLLDDEGRMSAARQAMAKGELGILGIGMNTVDLLVVRGGSPVQRFTAGETLGVRRLLELCRGTGAYSLAELDQMLRAHTLNLDGVARVWQSEVLGFIERHWGTAFRRFQGVVAVGGGVTLMRETLLRRFRERVYLPDDPIMATARGLFKYARMGAGQKRG